MNQIDTYLAQHPISMRTTVGYLVRGDAILLGVRKRVSFGLGAQLIAGIGGKLENGETDEQALEREFREEVGIHIRTYEQKGHATYVFPHKPAWNQHTSIYLITAWESEPQETDDILPLWFPRNALPRERMWPDNLYTIPRALAGDSIHGTFLYAPDGSIAEYQLT